jgi:hypothetical protein
MPALQPTPYAPLPYNRALYGNLAHLLCSWVNPLITAVTGFLVFAIARRLGLTAGWAVAAAFAYGVASPAAAFARFDYAQPLAALALTVAVWALMEVRSGIRVGRMLVAWVAVSALVVTRLELGLLLVWIGPWLLVEAYRRRARAVLLVLAVVAACAIVTVTAYLWIDPQAGRVFLARGLRALRLFRTPWSGGIYGILGVLLSPGRGLLVYFPLAWIAVPGLVRLVRERQPFGPLASGIVVTAVVFYGSYRGWWGGWTWGPRYLVPILPLVAVGAAFWASRRGRAGRTLFGGLAALGVVAAWNGIVMDFVLYYRWMHRALQLRERSGTFFDWNASPLVSGWAMLKTTPVDLLLLRMGEFGGVAGAVAAAFIAAALLATLVWTVRRIRAELSSLGGSELPVRARTS